MSVIQLYTEAIKRDPSLEEAKIHRFLAYRAIKMDQEALMDAENILASSRSANSCSIIGMNLRGKIGLRALEKALSLIDPNGNQVDLYAILERELKSRGSADE